MNSNKLAMTVEEATEYTGIGRNTMRQLIEWESHACFLKVGRKILIPTDVLIKFHIVESKCKSQRQKGDPQDLIGRGMID